MINSKDKKREFHVLSMYGYQKKQETWDFVSGFYTKENWFPININNTIIYLLSHKYNRLSHYLLAKAYLHGYLHVIKREIKQRS